MSIDPADSQDTVSDSVTGSVAASSAHRAELEHEIGVVMDLPDVPAAESKHTGPV